MAALLGRFGRGGAVVEEGPQGLLVKAYLPVDRALPKKKEELYTLLGHLSLIVPLKLEEEVLEEDWAVAWRAHFTPLHIGRLVIKPSWHNCTPGPGETVLELDPGQAFGTGHHPTTRMCLLLLEKYLRPGMEVLDLGTGSGILAIAAAKMGSGPVLAVDKDPIAVAAAQANIRRNRMGARIEVRVGTLEPGMGPYDLILANLLTPVLCEIAGLLAHALVPGGVLISSGVLLEQANSVAAEYSAAGLYLAELPQESDWIALVARR